MEESLRPIVGHSGSERRRVGQPVVRRDRRGALPPASGWAVGCRDLWGPFPHPPRCREVEHNTQPRARLSCLPSLSFVSCPSPPHPRRENDQDAGLDENRYEGAQHRPPPAPPELPRRRNPGCWPESQRVLATQWTLGVRRRRPRPPGKLICRGLADNRLSSISRARRSSSTRRSRRPATSFRLFTRPRSLSARPALRFGSSSTASSMSKLSCALI